MAGLAGLVAAVIAYLVARGLGLRGWAWAWAIGVYLVVGVVVYEVLAYRWVATP